MNIEPTERQKAEAHAELVRRRAELPEAVEFDAAPRFTPGVVVFVNGQYETLYPNVRENLPRLIPWIEAMLSFWPTRHRTEYWTGRIERGVCLATAFIGRDEKLEAAGIINLQRAEDDRPIVAAALYNEATHIDTSDLARYCEAIAMAVDADGVQLWAPRPTTLVAGYSETPCWFGQMQIAATKPIQ